jgi:hypothetical protein
MSNRGSGESRLIKEAKERFGAHLVSFLLAGYRELDIVNARCFEVLTEWRSLKTRKLIRIATGDASGLPQGEEPLVLLALLKLLVSGSDLVEGSKVVTPTEEICSVLEWNISSRTGAIINRAIWKYFRVSYLLAHDNQYSFPDMSGFSANISRLIVACAFSNQSGIENPLGDIGYIQVEFYQEIVEELRVARLLGMDWTRVISLECQ